MSKFIKKLGSLFDRMRVGQSKRSPLLLFAIALAIIIPTIFAIYFAYFYEENSFLSYNNISIELYDPDGKLIFSDEASKSDIGKYADLKMFYDIKNDAVTISEKPAAEKAEEYRLVYAEGDAVFEYLCHFSDTPEGSCLEGKFGELYAVPQKPYSLFLLTVYSEKVYSSSLPPSLFTGDEQAVLPTAVNWSYKRGGEFVKSENYTLSASTDSYSISGAINLSFDKKPSTCTAEVYDIRGNELYSGSFEDLSSLSFEIGKTVRVKLNASWKNTGTSVCFGRLNYDFYVRLATQAEFSVSAGELTAGELLVLSVENAQDINKIKYSPDLTAKNSYILSDEFESYTKEKLDAVNALYDFVPKFSDNGDTKITVIPIPLNMPDGTFVFTVSSGASSKNFEIEISAKEKGNYVNTDKPTEEFGKPLSIEQFLIETARLQKPVQNIIFYSSAFASPEESKFNAGYSCKSTVVSSDGKLKFSAVGNEYISTSNGGQAVNVLNSGTVVGLGYSTALGNYIAIEHGFGIRTWYCFLSEISVKNGDIVKKGDVIGKSGVGTALTGNGFLLLCSVYDIAIDPNFLFGKTFYTE